MIYGDDPLNLNDYNYAPSLIAIIQSGNLYTYVTNSPTRYCDPSGRLMDVAFSATWTSSVFGLANTIAAAVPVVAAVAVGTVLAKELSDNISEESKDHAPTRTWVRERVNSQDVDEQSLNEYSVYVINEKHTSKVVYVGMTKNYTKRQYNHQSQKTRAFSNARFPEDDYLMTPVHTGMNRKEARALEQHLINAYTLEALDNMINSIAVGRMDEFASETQRAIQLTTSSIDSFWE